MLIGERVILGPMLNADAPLLFEWINTRDLVLMNAPYRPIGEDRQAEWFRRIQRDASTDFFAVRERSSERMLGSCQLRKIHPIHRSAELQIRIARPEDRGRGFGTEAVRLLVGFGFRDRNLHRIELNVFADNLAARRAYAKAGFLEEGTRRQVAFINGKYVDLMSMGVLREEWESGRGEVR